MRPDQKFDRKFIASLNLSGNSEAELLSLVGHHGIETVRQLKSYMASGHLLVSDRVFTEICLAIVGPKSRAEQLNKLQDKITAIRNRHRKALQAELEPFKHEMREIFYDLKEDLKASSEPFVFPPRPTLSEKDRKKRQKEMERAAKERSEMERRVIAKSLALRASRETPASS